MKRYAKGFILSLGLFTIIPSPRKDWEENSAGAVLGSLPFVGLLLGIIYFASYRLLIVSGLSPLLFTPVYLLIWYGLTGFLHLDGFIDSSDALLSSRPLPERLRILKDPHAGGFGIVSVILLILFSAFSVVALAGTKTNGTVLLFLPILSRIASGLLLIRAKPVFDEGYGAYFQKNARKTDELVLWLSLFLSFALLWRFGGGAGLYAGIGLIVGFLLAALCCRRSFNGVNGDAAGFCLTVAEACGLFLLAALSS